MLLLRVYEQWHGISFLGDHFRVVERGRKLCVIIIIYLGSAFLSLCHRVLVCGRQLIFLVLCRKRIFFHEGTDALAEVTDLDVDIPQEDAACP